ncbi:copper amine oxidase N-terminal domain-containing protein [Paenibacillaceae bacterium WGS1546]|uniref:copper amine oxidase N-terminal domain-containing protein n=1 Tax=Cohnella sp. WGS1546 TaxID=3366810 RepID=UPI00372CF976
MNNKRILAAAATLILAVPAFAAPGFATQMIDENTVLIDYGRVENNRLLIPLREVARNMGAAVEWNQNEKSIRITKGDTDMRMTIDSKIVHMGQSDIELDVASRVYHSTTFVPLRFVSQTLGANVSWNQIAQEATILQQEGNDIVIRIKKELEQPAATEKATAARMELLNEKLNEAVDVSSLKQIRAHFKPYFTDRLINSIIANRGLKEKRRFNTYYGPYYTGKTTATMSQFIDIGRNQWGDTISIRRETELVRVDGVWKADSVTFHEFATPIAP